jgi:hypothetical protein
MALSLWNAWLQEEKRVRKAIEDLKLHQEQGIISPDAEPVLPINTLPKPSNPGTHRATLIIVPSINLILQWCRELAKLSKYLKTFIYHKDQKLRAVYNKHKDRKVKRKADKAKLDPADEDPTYDTDDSDVDPDEEAIAAGMRDPLLSQLPSGCTVIWTKLHKNHPMLTNIPEGEVRVIFTTPETFRLRHGPKKLYDFRVGRARRQAAAKMRGASDQRIIEISQKLQEDIDYFARAGFHEPDPTWMWCLDGMFDFGIVDEAHGLRNPDATVNIAIKWLNLPKILLLTATPIWGSPASFRGYLVHLATMRGIAVYKNLPKGEAADAFNPYDGKRRRQLQLQSHDGRIPEDVRRLALVPEAFARFAHKFGSVVSGAKTTHSAEVIEAMYADTVVQHTYESSMVPGNPKYAISTRLPQLFQVRIVTQMTPELTRLFTHYAQYHYLRLRMPIKAKKYKTGGSNDDIGINSNASRALVWGSTWPLGLVIGLPKNHRWVKSQIRSLEEKRDKHVEAVQAAWDEKNEGSKNTDDGDSDEDMGEEDIEHVVDRGGRPSKF